MLTIITLIWTLSPNQAFTQETYILNNNCTCGTIGFNVSHVQLALMQDFQSHAPVIDVYMTFHMSSYVPHELGNWKDRDLPCDKDVSGGVLIYISDKLSYIHRDDLETNNVESIWIEHTHKSRPSHLI